jgi:hypothetical protein
MAGSKILFVAVSGTVGVVASVATHTDHTALVLFGCGLLGLCLLVLIIIARVLFVPQDYPADRLLNLLKTIRQPRTHVVQRTADHPVEEQRGLGRIRPRLNATVNRCWSGS